MKAVIFNSGLGKRMEELTSSRPKAMVTLEDGETIFERQLRILYGCGIRNFVITTGPFPEQLFEVSKRFPDAEFQFVENPIYDQTNYIYSMYLAREYLNEDCLLLHGDLVFDATLVEDILASDSSSLALVHKGKQLPEKDFKGRVEQTYLKEVSIHIFDDDCYAFQPFYKLSKEVLNGWVKEVEKFILNGNHSVYAENALNEILTLYPIEVMSYCGHYIDEVDTKDDLARVSKEIVAYEHHHLQEYESMIALLKHHHPFLVCSKRIYQTLVQEKFPGIPFVLFSDFASNPSYDQIKMGVQLFLEKNCDFIVAIGGGSAIDVAKSIKMFAVLDPSQSYLKQDLKPSKIPFLTIPTTAGTGSEATTFAVLYDQNKKYSIAHEDMIPEYVFFDPMVLKTLPLEQKRATVLDALSQAMESLISTQSTVLSREYAKEAIRLILTHYHSYFENQEPSFGPMQQGANLSGRAINISKTTAAHALSYQLTIQYGIPHGFAVSLVLPSLFRYLKEHLSESNDKRGVIHVKQRLEEINQLFETSDLEQVLDSYHQIQGDISKYLQSILPSDLEQLVSLVNENRLKNFPLLLSNETIRMIYFRSFRIEGETT